MNEPSAQTRQFIRQVLIAAGIIISLLVLLVFLWHALRALLLVFAAILFAIFLDGLARLLGDRLSLPRLLSLGLLILLFIGLTAVFMALAGPQIGDQIVLLWERIPEALGHLRSNLAEQRWGRAILEAIPEPETMVPSFADILQRVSGVFTTALGAITNLVIILLIGFYIALNPRIYVDNLIYLLPIPKRERGRAVFESLGLALHWWLLGRVTAMVVVGVLTSLGLWIVGMPLVLALGFIAGVLSFVPYIGPIIAAIPAILIAVAEQGILTAVYVIFVYGAVQFLEGNVATPIIQKYAVSLLPAVLLIAQFLMGVQFGLFGVLLATPLAVAVIVLIQMLYVEDVLGDRVRVLGERHGLQ